MIPWLDDGDVRLYQGEAAAVLRDLPAASVQTCVTSPPYWGLRDYGTGTWTGGNPDCDHLGEPFRTKSKQTCSKCDAQRVDDQLGLEPTPAAYVERLVGIFREVRRVLRDDGTLWLNLGDSYANDLKWGGSSGGKHVMDGQTGEEGYRVRRDTGLKPKDLVGIPWRVAFALQQPYYAGRIRDERDRIWLAAVLDSEGCIHIHKRNAGADSGAKFTRADGTEARYARTQDTYGVMVSIDNTSLALVERFRDLIGQGSWYTHEAGVGKSNRKQTLYRLTLTGQQSRELLRELYPHLVAKRQEARIAYHTPSSGPKAEEAWQAVKMLHNGIATTVDAAAPPSCFEPGWYLRSDIIWGKPNPMPESVTDRPTKAHEYLFLLSKQPRYFYDADAIREANVSPEQAEHNARYARVYEAHTERVGNGQGIQPGNVNNLGIHARGGATTGRNRRSVWEIATQPFPEAHFATYPEALVRPCILAGSKPGDLVLDPFIGSGTTAHVARNHGRRCIGIDLSAEYLGIAARRLQQLSLLAEETA